MLEFYASDWNDIIRQFDAITNILNPIIDAALNAGDKEQVLTLLRRIATLCEKLELNYSASYAREFIGEVEQRPSLAQSLSDVFSKTPNTKKTMLPDYFVREVGIIRKRFDDELKLRELLVVEGRHFQYYRNPVHIFGHQVADAFPSAWFDMEEAAKCLALGRSTACIMHLSRVVEAGLKALAKELNLPERPDWGKSLKDIETELTKRYQGSRRTPDEIFFSEAAAQIGYIKTSWRNPTMHLDRAYTEEKAGKILLAIQSLMQHLATRLHE